MCTQIANHKFYFSLEKCGKSIKNPLEADDGKKRHLWEIGPKVKQKLWRHTHREGEKSNKNQRTIDDNEVQAYNRQH